MSAISSTLSASFSAPGEPPAAALARWRKTPPDWLPAHYKEVDDSYNSVTWEWRHVQATMKLVTFGGLLPGAATAYRITAMFDDDGARGSRITVNGAADVKTRAAIAAAADQVFSGGLV